MGLLKHRSALRQGHYEPSHVPTPSGALANVRGTVASSDRAEWWLSCSWAVLSSPSLRASLWLSPSHIGAGMVPTGNKTGDSPVSCTPALSAGIPEARGKEVGRLQNP